MRNKNISIFVLGLALGCNMVTIAKANVKISMLEHEVTYVQRQYVELKEENIDLKEKIDELDL